MDRPAALAPYRVIDLTGELGVLCPRLFAGFGADVIRIEPPGGDSLRKLAPFTHTPDGDGPGLWWLQQMEGRRSLELDLASEAGRDAFRRLVRTADFVIESRHDELAALGLDYDDLAAENERLIWVSITPFGRTGPRAHWKGTDLIGMAAGGLLYLCGDRDRPPVRVTVEAAYAQAGVQAAAGAMMALTVRAVSGRGQLVDVSMQEAIVNALGNARLYHVVEGVINERTGGGRSYGSTGMRLIYASADGYIAFSRMPGTFAALGQWMVDEGFPVAFDVAEWSARPTAGAGALSPEEATQLDAAIEPFFASKPTMELFHEGQRRRLLIAPVATVADLLESEQLRARSYFVELTHPKLPAPYVAPGAPAKMSATPWRSKRAPLPGEHTAEILAELAP